MVHLFSQSSNLLDRCDYYHHRFWFVADGVWVLLLLWECLYHYLTMIVTREFGRWRFSERWGDAFLGGLWYWMISKTDLLARRGYLEDAIFCALIHVETNKQYTMLAYIFISSGAGTELKFKCRLL